MIAASYVSILPSPLDHEGVSTMNTISRSGILSAVLLSAAVGCIAQGVAAPATTPAAAASAVGAEGQLQAQSACGNQPLCVDTPDFTATVTDFRLTNANGMKVMDVTLRFQNKTAETLILGYEDRSEMAMDEQGNRYVPNPWGNAYRGIGVVVGNNMDPKFSLRAGSWGDASFELVWRPGAQDPIGSSFEYALSVREINTLPGNQHSLGGEFPLHFQGLANGIRGVSPGYSGAAYPGGAVAGSPILAGGQSLPPCGAAGALSTVTGVAGGTGNQSASNAASQVSNAASTLSSLGSIFGRKKQAAANAAANGVPCAASALPATVRNGPYPLTSSIPASAAVSPAAAPINPANKTAGTPAAPATPASGKVISASQNKATIPAASNAKSAAAKPVTAAPAAIAPAAPAPSANVAKPVKAATPAPIKKPAPAKPDTKKPAQQ
jgi:hypothetical protein